MKVGNMRFLLLLAASLAFCLAQDIEDPFETEEVDAGVNTRGMTSNEIVQDLARFAESEVEGTWTERQVGGSGRNIQKTHAGQNVNFLSSHGDPKRQNLQFQRVMTIQTVPIADYISRKITHALTVLKGCKTSTINSEISYVHCHQKVTWMEARRKCRQAGLEMISIETEEENSALARALGRGYCSIWTSGTDLGSEGQFYWASTLQPFSFSSWKRGQPNNAGHEQHCVNADFSSASKVMLWKDGDCSKKKYFACEVTKVWN